MLIDQLELILSDASKTNGVRPRGYAWFDQGSTERADEWLEEQKEQNGI